MVKIALSDFGLIILFGHILWRLCIEIEKEASWDKYPQAEIEYSIETSPEADNSPKDF